MSSNTLNLVKRFWIEDKDVRLKGWGLLVLVLFLQVARAKSYTYLSQLARNQMNAIVKFVTKASSNSPSFPPSNEYEDVERSIVKHMAGVIILYPIGKIYSLTLRYLQQMWISHLTKQLLRNYVENLSHVKKISLNKRAQESKPHALSESNNKDKSKQEEGGDNDDDDDDDGDDEEQNPPHDNDEETKEKEKKSKKSGKQKNAIKYEELIHPDQRIADDCEKFVQVFLSLTLEMFEAGIHLYFFASLLRSISPRLGRDALLAATFGTIATLTIGGKLPLLYKHERDANGQYRYFLTRCREYAESIAFIGGQHRELAVLEAKHERVLSTIWSRRALQDAVGYFTTTYSKVASLVPIFVLLSKIIENGHDHHGHSHTEADHHGHSHVEADNHGHSHSAADKDHHGHSHAAPSIGGHGHSHGGIEVDHNEGNSKDISLKNIDVGTFSQVVEAYGEILFHLSIVSERYHDFARLKAYSNELQSLFDQTEKTNILTDEDNRVEIQYLEEDSVNNEWLKFDDLTLYIPLHPSLHKKPNPAASAASTATNHTTAHDTSIPGSDKVLIRSLSIRAPVTGGLLVSGGSGVGKTTLLRAVAGLWEYGQGKVQRRKQIFFIPQVPYMLIGTLREQLYYPNYPPTETGDDEEDNRLIGLLDRVGLSHISMRLNESRAWGEELSLGEQQRIAFARLVLSGARYAILDEATSACDIENEAKMYEILEEHCVAWVSVGHRPTIERFHEEKLFLEPNGVWHLFARSQGSDGSEVLDHSFSQINSDILISPLKSFDDGSNNGHILRAGESDGLLSNGFSSPEPIILTPTISTVPSEGSDKIENKNQGR